MYGQLMYTFLAQKSKLPLSLSAGCITYNKEVWTKDQNVLFALYYLGTAELQIFKFDEERETQIVSPNKTIPTLSPNDPRFEAWSKTVIEE